MKSASIRSPKPDRKTPALQQQPNGPQVKRPPAPPLLPCEDLIQERAYELYSERGYRDGSAVDDWLEAEREILRQNRRSDRST
jgi:hypothetical protein